MQTRLDPIALLERPDKWYLGGGQAVLFAPTFPKALDTPGFWDEAYFADIRLDRLFCLLFLDENARPLNLRRAVRRWTPDRLLQLYTIEGMPHLQIQEERVVTPNDTLASRITLTNSGTEPTRLHIFQWSLQEQSELRPDSFVTTVEAVQQENDLLSFAHHVHYGKPGETPADVYGWGEREPEKEQEASTRLFVALGGSRLPDSWTINLAERSDFSPLWQVSVLPEKFQNGTLAQEMQTEAGWNPNGLLHLNLHYFVETPSLASETLTFGASIALSREEALANLRADMTGDVAARSRANWDEWFASVPYFECSNPYLERLYWYRWYGLRLLRVEVGKHPQEEATNHTLPTSSFPFPCIFEGIGAFRSHISYSAQCHIRELAWRHDPALAMGCLENFLAAQTQREDDPENGFLPGHLYLWRQNRGFYHADWGAAARQIYYLTGDTAFVRRVYDGLTRYADYFDRVRDRENSGLYDVLDQGETGQEYMSRYLFADEKADTWRKIQVKGVDASCYLYSLQRTLAIFARVQEKHEEAAWWDEKADYTGEAICDRMWDADARLFKDVHPQTFALSPCKAAVGFYPFLMDIATEAHLSAWEHLTDPATFGTAFPLPASSADDPLFDPEAGWKGKRTNCPWNGRVWPMTNAHVSAALAHTARTLDPRRRSLAAEFLLKFVRMLFHDGDPKRPNTYEHYNPLTGMPCLYRGVDDYQHSWMIDLIIQQVAGVLPEPGTNGFLIVDPLPFALESFRLEDVPVRGYRIDVRWNLSEGFVVIVDGQERVQLPEPQRVEIEL